MNINEKYFSIEIANTTINNVIIYKQNFKENVNI